MYCMYVVGCAAWRGRMRGSGGVVFEDVSISNRSYLIIVIQNIILISFLVSVLIVMVLLIVFSGDASKISLPGQNRGKQ